MGAWRLPLAEQPLCCALTPLPPGSPLASPALTHLTLRQPATPGTTTRSGKPWSAGSGAPFIS